MKRLFTLAAISMLALFCATEASAQLRFGVKAGANFNQASIKLDDYKNGKNMTGFQIGPVLEYDINFGVATLGVEGSLLFSQKGVKFTEDMNLGELGKIAGSTFKSNYIEIPVNAKLYFGVAPAVRLFVHAGPSFNFNISKKEVEANVAGEEIGIPSGLERQKVGVGLQAGVGVEVLKIVQISAGYSASMAPDYKFVSIVNTGKDFLDTKNKGFTISAAVLF